MEDFKNLRVWAKAHELTLSVYQKTRCFPKEEMYGLTSQIRRSAASVARKYSRRMWSQVGWRDEALSADRPWLGK